MNENEEKIMSENNIDTNPGQETKNDNNNEPNSIKETSIIDEDSNTKTDSTQEITNENQENKPKEEIQNNNVDNQEKNTIVETQETKSEETNVATTSNNNQKNSNTSKIILIIIIVLLVIGGIVGTIVIRIIMPILAIQSTTNNIIEDASDIINDGYNSMQIEDYNSELESYVGTQNGSDVQLLLDTVILKLKKDTSRIITVSYNDNETFDTNELTNIKNQIDPSKQYEVSMNYDNDGYINVISFYEI